MEAGVKLPTRPTDPEFVHAEERVLDEWSTDAARFRLVERAGVYRLETWELYRWVTAEQGFQAVARRVAELARESPAKLFSIAREARL